VRRSTLTVIAVVSLLATAILGLAVAPCTGPSWFEGAAIRTLNPGSAAPAWANLAELLAVPVIGAVLVAALAYGALKRAVGRVAVYAGFAASAFVISEHIVKPLVHETYYGELSFPSGNVTAVCATALAMWMALHPLLGRWARAITFALGAAWVMLISLAVVGGLWHTPLDVIGSLLLSVGIVTAGAAVFERDVVPRSPTVRATRAHRVGLRSR
jgi:membrane-associated phospholipid phosphatase